MQCILLFHTRGIPLGFPFILTFLFSFCLRKSTFRLVKNKLGRTWKTTFDIYLLLVECEVRTGNYGSSFFPSFYSQVRSAQAMKTRKEKTRLERANEANKILLNGFVDYSGKERNHLAIWQVTKPSRGPYGYLGSWNWPITAREITQPYNNSELFLNVSANCMKRNRHMSPKREFNPSGVALSHTHSVFKLHSGYQILRCLEMDSASAVLS